MNAFADVSLQRIQEFHLWPLNTSTPNAPYQSLLRPLKPTKQGNPLTREPGSPKPYLIIPCWAIHGTAACFEHSNLFTVKDQAPCPNQINGRTDRLEGMAGARRHPNQRLGRVRQSQKSNYELFNCSNISIRYWSWYYRGCWHQTCPPMVPR